MIGPDVLRLMCAAMAMAQLVGTPPSRIIGAGVLVALVIDGMWRMWARGRSVGD